MSKIQRDILLKILRVILLACHLISRLMLACHWQVVRIKIINSVIKFLIKSILPVNYNSQYTVGLVNHCYFYPFSNFFSIQFY